MTAIGILGATGRMGRAIAEVAGELGAMIDDAAPDALVDFTAPDALAANLARALAARVPILIGTTGLAPDHHAMIDRAATAIPVLQTANTSLGINLLRLLVEQAARRLGPDWDIEILETHHRHKRDAPSGTALLLGAAANAGRGPSTPGDRFDRGRAGPHPREEGGVYYASLRGGSVAGDHLVIFAGEGERLELGHRAESRAIFARGAVRAALWLAGGRAPGRYGMADVLAAD